MYLDIIKNPIFLGVVAGVLTYLYLLWSNDKKKNPKAKNISLMTPIIVAIVVAVVGYAYFCNSCEIPQNALPANQLPSELPMSQILPSKFPAVQAVTPVVTTPIIASQQMQPTIAKSVALPGQAMAGQVVGGQTVGGQNYHFANDLSSESPATFHLISRGVNIPNNLNVPDVFIETY